MPEPDRPTMDTCSPPSTSRSTPVRIGRRLPSGSGPRGCTSRPAWDGSPATGFIRTARPSGLTVVLDRSRRRAPARTGAPARPRRAPRGPRSCSPSVSPRVTARSSGSPPSATTQTLPVCTAPWTAVIGTTRTFSVDLRPAIATVALIPANTVVPAGTEHRAVVPPGRRPAPGRAPGRRPPGVGRPVAGAPRTRPVQVNGAGPPWTSTSAVAGGESSRNCSAWVSVAVTDRVPGEIEPTGSPTATIWSTSTSSEASRAARGRGHGVVRDHRSALGDGRVALGVGAGDRRAAPLRADLDQRLPLRDRGALRDQQPPHGSRRRWPSPARRRGGDHRPSHGHGVEHRAAGDRHGGLREGDGGRIRAVRRGAVVLPPPPPKARTTSATAMTAHTSRRRAGNTMVRIVLIGVLPPLGHSSVPVPRHRSGPPARSPDGPRRAGPGDAGAPSGSVMDTEYAYRLL